MLLFLSIVYSLLLLCSIPPYEYTTVFCLFLIHIPTDGNMVKTLMNKAAINILIQEFFFSFFGGKEGVKYFHLPWVNNNQLYS